MAQLFFNNARGVLDAPITATDTTVRVADAEGLPAALAPGDFFLLTIYKDSRRYGEDHEVVKVIGVTSEASPAVLVFEVVRGEEQAPLDHVAGEPIEARLTAGTMAETEKTRKNVKLMQLGIELL